MKRKPKKRARAERREQDRDAEKTRELVRKVAESAPAGSPEKAVELSSASQIEVVALQDPCPLCAARLTLRGHDAVTEGALRVRRIALFCESCRSPWHRYYRLGPVLN